MSRRADTPRAPAAVGQGPEADREVDPFVLQVQITVVEAAVQANIGEVCHELRDDGDKMHAAEAATRTAFWGPAVEGLPAAMVMDAEELVDAALAGLDAGEDITIPSLPDRADWDGFNAARGRLGPNLSRQHEAARYAQAPV